MRTVHAKCDYWIEDFFFGYGTFSYDEPFKNCTEAPEKVCMFCYARARQGQAINSRNHVQAFSGGSVLWYTLV